MNSVSGTMMVRKARIDDVKVIFKFIEGFAVKGDMLHRPVSEIYNTLRDFYVYEVNGVILGTCALHVCWEDLAEVRSLAVDERAKEKGIGKALINACIEDAKTLGVTKLFALTYKEGYFKKMGFEIIDMKILPHKIWTDCVKCVKFPECDETAVMLILS
jgi:amino-acid N-acetyltransferase